MILLDTHVSIWALQDDPKLKRQARLRLDAEAESSRLLISAITLWEIAMLAEKGRLVLGGETGRWLDRSLALPSVELTPLTAAISVDSVRLAAFHADPADRIIVATARFHRIPLMTADQAILDYGRAGHVEIISASL